jgi:arabinose operon protein AraL
MTLSIDTIDGYIFDLDGTLYLGEAALPGAVETLAELHRKGKRTLFVTNKPLFPRGEYAAKLERLGIPASPDDVITSGYVLGYHLAHTAPHLALYVVGEQNLLDELRSHGLNVLPELSDQDEKGVIDPSGIDAVVVAFDRTLTYRKLNTAYQALMRGARFFATNPDKTCPMPGGGIPDAGATLAALETISGRKLELLAGKPSPLMMQVALQRLSLPPERCLFTGDRLETDIRMAKQAGMYAAVVLSGISTRQQAETADPPPDLILENVGELLSAIKP